MTVYTTMLSSFYSGSILPTYNWMALAYL